MVDSCYRSDLKFKCQKYAVYRILLSVIVYFNHSQTCTLACPNYLLKVDKTYNFKDTIFLNYIFQIKFHVSN